MEKNREQIVEEAIQTLREKHAKASLVAHELATDINNAQIAQDQKEYLDVKIGIVNDYMTEITKLIQDIEATLEV